MKGRARCPEHGFPIANQDVWWCGCFREHTQAAQAAAFDREQTALYGELRRCVRCGGYGRNFDPAYFCPPCKRTVSRAAESRPFMLVELRWKRDHRLALVLLAWAAVLWWLAVRTCSGPELGPPPSSGAVHLSNWTSGLAVGFFASLALLDHLPDDQTEPQRFESSAQCVAGESFDCLMVGIGVDWWVLQVVDGDRLPLVQLDVRGWSFVRPVVRGHGALAEQGGFAFVGRHGCGDFRVADSAGFPAAAIGRVNGICAGERVQMRVPAMAAAGDGLRQSDSWSSRESDFEPIDFVEENQRRRGVNVIAGFGGGARDGDEIARQRQQLAGGGAARLTVDRDFEYETSGRSVLGPRARVVLPGPARRELAFAPYAVPVSTTRQAWASGSGCAAVWQRSVTPDAIVGAAADTRLTRSVGSAARCGTFAASGGNARGHGSALRVVGVEPGGVIGFGHVAALPYGQHFFSAFGDVSERRSLRFAGGLGIEGLVCADHAAELQRVCGLQLPADDLGVRVALRARANEHCEQRSCGWGEAFTARGSVQRGEIERRAAIDFVDELDDRRLRIDDAPARGSVSYVVQIAIAPADLAIEGEGWGFGCLGVLPVHGSRVARPPAACSTTGARGVRARRRAASGSARGCCGLPATARSVGRAAAAELGAVVQCESGTAVSRQCDRWAGC